MPRHLRITMLLAICSMSWIVSAGAMMSSEWYRLISQHEVRWSILIGVVGVAALFMPHLIGYSRRFLSADATGDRTVCSYSMCSYSIFLNHPCVSQTVAYARVLSHTACMLTHLTQPSNKLIISNCNSWKQKWRKSQNFYMQFLSKVSCVHMYVYVYVLCMCMLCPVSHRHLRINIC